MHAPCVHSNDAMYNASGSLTLEHVRIGPCPVLLVEQRDLVLVQRGGHEVAKSFPHGGGPDVLLQVGRLVPQLALEADHERL